MRRNGRFMIVFFFLLLSGCGEVRQEGAGQTYVNDDVEYMLGVGLDMSGSYEELMCGQDGRAFQCSLKVIDTFFRDRGITSGDRLVLMQISAIQRAMLWDGTPGVFRRQFGSANAFKTYLRGKSNPNGSRVFTSMREQIEYVSASHDRNPKMKSSAVIFFTDMEDNFPNTAEEKAKLIESLKAYARKGGVVGIYWVANNLVPEWRGILKDCGFKSYCVESSITADPQMPTFD